MINDHVFQIKQEFLEETFQQLSPYAEKIDRLYPSPEQVPELQEEYGVYIDTYGGVKLKEHYAQSDEFSTWDHLKTYYQLAYDLAIPEYRDAWYRFFPDGSGRRNHDHIWLDYINQIIDLLEEHVRFAREMF